jgi:hypothetical protein
MTSFQAGIALGPAIGGVSIHHIGIPLTYASCGALFAAIASINHFFLKETMPSSIEAVPSTVKSINNEIGKTKSDSSASSDGVLQSFRTAFSTWHEMSSESRLMNLALLNSFYWLTLAGVQMTILPLYMVSPVHMLGPGQIGASFALMSVCSVISSQPIAYISDKTGKVSVYLLF